jgi:signal transduction histidine kinase
VTSSKNSAKARGVSKKKFKARGAAKKNSAARKKPAPLKKRRGDSSLDGIHDLEEQLRAVRAMGEAYSKSVGLDALFEKIVPNITKLMRAARSTLFLYDPVSKQIWSKVAEGEGSREIRLNLGQGIAGWVAKRRKSVNIEDAYRDFRFNSSVDARTGFKTRSVAAIPLIDRKGHLVGALQVLNRRGGPFTDGDMGLLHTIGVQTSFAVENARQAQEIIDQNRDLDAARLRAEQRRAELNLLYQLEQETTASSDLDQLLDSIIVRACERLRSQAGSVLLLAGDTGRLFFRGVGGENTEELRQLSLSSGEGIVGRVAQGRSPIIINRPDEDDRQNMGLAEKIELPVHALMAVPLIWDDQVIGAVEVLNPRPSSTGAVPYDDEDLKILTLIAGQVARAVALTQQRQARIETDRLVFLGRMLAGVAHDLRNPMTVISGYTQLMAIEASMPKREARCDQILEHIDEMTAMIADLLAFARGKTELKPAMVDIQKLAADLEGGLNVLCDPRGIKLVIKAEGGGVMIDIARVKRIINNLAKNAVDVLKRDEKLTIGLKVSEKCLSISVTDTGPGIPDEVSTHLFEPFVTAGKKDGTGLGLSIVKRFVDDHAGTIRVKSRPGVGTSFFVDLPIGPMQSVSQ